MISSTSVIHPNVTLGTDCVIEEFCVIGAPPAGREPGELPTWIGDGARIRSHTVIYAGNRIGHRFQTGHKANIREMNEIGDDVSVGTLSVVEHHARIGHRVRIHTQAFIPEFSLLEDDCWIGPQVVLTNAKYPQSDRAKYELCGPRVGCGAIVGANVTVLPGVCLADGCLIGAGSVVTKDVPARAVMSGNPARFIKWVCELPASYSKRGPAKAA
jgi:acetyltransferase-like isoleucine patch superfamily enzyme